MKKSILILACAFGMFACSNDAANKTTETETEDVEVVESNDDSDNEDSWVKGSITSVRPYGSIYSCDDCFPGLVASFYQYGMGEDGSIEGMWYWDNKNDDKTQLVILSQEFMEGEISGWVGEFKFPGNNDVYEFGIIEDRFTVTQDGDFYEYEYVEHED